MTNDKLVVAISSRALFDLNDSHEIYLSEGVEAYRKHQIEHEDVILPPGDAFLLVEKLLGINAILGQARVEVVLETDHVSAGRLENVLREWCHVHRAVFLAPVYGSGVELAVQLRPRDLASYDQLVAAETAGGAVPVVRGWQVSDVPAGR